MSAKALPDVSKTTYLAIFIISFACGLFLTYGFFSYMIQKLAVYLNVASEWVAVPVVATLALILLLILLKNYGHQN